MASNFSYFLSLASPPSVALLSFRRACRPVDEVITVDTLFHDSLEVVHSFPVPFKTSVFAHTSTSCLWRNVLLAVKHFNTL